MIIVHGLYFVIMMINGLPAPNRILGIISLREIVAGWKLDFKKNCRAPFDVYIEASTNAIMTNDMSPRTRGSLSLGPAGNLQGFLKCFDLDKGRVVVRHSFRVLHMSDCMVKLAKFWGKTSRVPSHHGTDVDF